MILVGDPAAATACRADPPAGLALIEGADMVELLLHSLLTCECIGAIDDPGASWGALRVLASAVQAEVPPGSSAWRIAQRALDALP